MVTRIFSLLLLACLASVLFSCGGGSSSGTDFTNNSAPRATLQQDDQAALDAKFAEFLANPGTPGVDYAPDRIVVQYKQGAQLPASLGGPNPAWTALASSAPNAILRTDKSYEPITGAIAGKYGLEIHAQVYQDIQTFASFEIPAGGNGDALLAQIRAEFASAIESAFYPPLCRASWTPSDQYYVNSNASNGPQWGQVQIGCTAAWDITRGSPSVLMADIDTGVRVGHNDLDAQVLDPAVEFPTEKCNVYDNNNNVSDQIGHGTFIAGLMSAQANAGGPLIGVAPECRVIPIKISDPNGLAGHDDMAQGVALAASLGAKVMNLSWGGEFPSGILQTMVNQQKINGNLLIIAAGNEGDNGNPKQYPGGYQNAYTVGSTGATDARSDFSNYGSAGDPWVKFAAPGEWLTSAGPVNDSNYLGPQQGWGFGTSFSAPIVASACALMWSVKPSLTNLQIWDKLIEHGEPTTGFGYAVPRLNLIASLTDVAGLQLGPARVPRLISSGVVQLTPDVQGSVDRIECYLDGVLVDEKTSAPWTFNVDTSAIAFGEANVEFRGFDGPDQRSAFTKLAVDNSGSLYPVLEQFELAGGAFMAYDARGLTQAGLDGLYDLPAGDRPIDDFMSQGPATFRQQLSGGYLSAGHMSCIGDSGSHGAYEIDTLISRKIAVPDDNPSLVFYHKYNLEKGAQDFDRAYVFVTADGGQNYTIAKQKNATDARWSGLQASWWHAEVDLSPFAGQTVNLVFSLQTDAATAGQDTGQPAGWWIDAVTIATDYNKSIPLISGVKVNGVVHAGVNLDALSVFGQVPDKLKMDLEIVQPTNVNEVTYIVDVLPYGAFDPGSDLKVEMSGAAPWKITVDLPPTLDNQLVNLRVQYVDNNDVSGPEVTVPVWLFNQPGDVNGDGSVGQADLDAFPAAIGSQADDAGFIPFFDTDLDGTVRENDAAAVGYFWGS